MNHGLKNLVRIGTTLSMLTLSASWLAAHDFWIVPVDFDPDEGQTIEVQGQTSTRFPTSESAVAVVRVAEALLIGSKTSQPITDLSVQDKSLLLRNPARPAGQYVVGVRLQPASARSSPEAFRRYLQLEGAAELAARYDREGRLPTDSITRRSIKYAKTYVQVGRNGPRSFSSRAGHPLELVLLQDPSQLHAGDTVSVLVELLGKPLVEANLHAGYAPFNDRSALNGGAGPAGDLHIVTDGRGIAWLPVAHAGYWNVRTIHALESATPKEWDVHWATLVFGVADRH